METQQAQTVAGTTIVALLVSVATAALPWLLWKIEYSINQFIPKKIMFLNIHLPQIVTVFMAFVSKVAAL